MLGPIIEAKCKLVSDISSFSELISVSFQVDKIVEQLMQFIYSYDLVSLKELWAHLDQRMFSKLEHSFTPCMYIISSSLILYIN
jgi:hypothetical protein